MGNRRGMVGGKGVRIKTGDPKLEARAHRRQAEKRLAGRFLDMPFGEALERFAQTKPAEMHASIKRARHEND